MLRFVAKKEYNAPRQIVKPLIETELEEWGEVMAVNVRAAYLFIKYA